ncbi:OLC1v1035459C1 [Oldenlandia corymbosa var. corymbosa]|uniref:OLC1v1035459C1 n=1 Tax=Oldenlandia corymbosa var. corymbosa TaxID=529605 RepID=A0AAV1CUX7_OLDCO|nr:OLC1v1035459C1 [Oldenlandia corymbosa var. corymbosa]
MATRPCLASVLIASLALFIFVAFVDADCLSDCLVGCADAPPPVLNLCIRQCNRECGCGINGQTGFDSSSFKDKARCFFLNKCIQCRSDKKKLADCVSKC